MIQESENYTRRHEGNGKYDIKDFLEMKNSELLKMNKGKKFDIILANPPFNLGERMLIKWFDIANEICTVQPSTWLLGKKQKKDIVKNVDTWEKTEIESIQCNEHFDAAIGGVMAIQHFIKGDNKNNTYYDKQKRIKFDGKWYKECKGIRKYSNDELLVEFKNIIEPIYQTDNLDIHLKVNKKRIPSGGDNRFFEPSPNPDWYILQINRYKAGPYAIITNTKEIQNKIGIYKSYPDINKRIFYLNYDNIKNLYNSINYFKTYFCRISLYLSMHNDELIGGGALKTIPWFDFSNSIFNGSTEEIDIKLFKKYGVRQEIINHILDILPNYYNLDLTKYKVEN